MDVEYEDSDNEILNEFGTDSEDETDLFTEEQKTQNWLQVYNATKFIENDGRITEDWMEEQKYHILKWRDWIPNFSTLNQDVEDPAFRAKCSYAEQIITHLVESIRQTNTFDPSVYLLLLKSIEYIRASITNVDDITEWITNMSVSSS